MSVRLAEPLIEVSKVFIDCKQGRSIESRRRDARERKSVRYKNRTPEQIQANRDRQIKYCDRDEAGKKAERQRIIAIQKKRYKTNSKARKLQIRYVMANVRTVSAFDINHSLNNKTAKRTYCFVCRKRMNREYHARKKAEKAMING